ncbi:protein-arginine deiminase family protein [Serinicoccus kebangsaanensis]|uniref:protein-arginine deiminase family protein n=1 Tax=Serinicoccus kebangsaanensis TaxID=2602069 RepID=UPI00124D5004|nr:protein-arginine deiminase family protein [Serinicoccus kebangsaanensis]
MTGRLELHADFDRDGLLTSSADERSARLAHPGCIVVPNLDRDQRALSGSVGGGSGGDPTPDYDLATAFTRDDELVPIQIRVLAGGGPGPGEELVAHLPGMLMHTRVRLSDSTGVIVPHRLGRPDTYVLPSVPTSGVLDLTLQVRTIAGASFGRLASIDTAYRAVDVADDRFILAIGYERPDGTFTEEDRGCFSVAPAILDDCLAPATRVYAASVPGNAPSLADLRRAASAAGVPVVEVPESLNSGDAWLQDQFQHAHVEGPSGFRQLVLHLPRMASNSAVGPDAANLRGFVDSHFRSADLGVYAGLWRRELPVSTASGGVARFTPVTLAEVLVAVARVADLPRLFLQSASVLTSAASSSSGSSGGSGTPSGPSVTFTEDWVATVRAIPDNLRTIDDLATAAKSAAPSLRREADVDALVAEVRRQVAEALRGVTVAGPQGRATVTLPVSGSAVAFSEEIARKVVTRAEQMQGSAVYGGNIESTPPVPGADLGKILLGNRSLQGGAEFMDPDVLRLLVAQRRQPIVELDTTWLDVGHVDEMFAVVPRPSSGFAVLHASSAMALALLREASRLQMTGLPIEDPDSSLRRPSGVLPRLMDGGPHPVTRLFRGKMWKHLVGSARPGGPNTDVQPPRIFQNLTFEFGDSDAFNVHPIGMVRGAGERYYRADITPAEILWCETDSRGDSTQEILDTSVLEPSRQLLRSELGAPVLPLPVLWDAVPDLTAYRPWPPPGSLRTPTSAFSPDCANLVVLGSHLLVPKPYGPRMLVDDAVQVVRTVMEGVDGLESARSRVGRRLISARRMTRETTWVRRQSPAYDETPSGTIRRSYGGMQDVDDLVAVFKDSFPGQSAEEVGRRLRRANAGALDGRGLLRDEFSRIRVADGMVDLFELFIAAVVEDLGLTLHFIDSWYYHLHMGQIHCGTNVLRRPTRAGRPRVWDVPEWTGFRARTVIFEDDPVTAAP